MNLSLLTSRHGSLWLLVPNPNTMRLEEDDFEVLTSEFLVSFRGWQIPVGEDGKDFLLVE